MGVSGGGGEEGGSEERRMRKLLRNLAAQCESRSHFRSRHHWFTCRSCSLSECHVPPGITQNGENGRLANGNKNRKSADGMRGSTQQGCLPNADKK